MLIILLLYCLLGFWVLWSPGALKKYSALLIALLQLGSFAYFLSHVPYVREGFIKSQFISWIPQLGLDFHVQIDGLSLLYALLVTFIGALVFLYAKAYMKKYANKSRFYFFLTWFSGAMLGLVLSVNLIQLFVFWELTSLFSFLLISFFNEKESSRKAAFQSLFVTGFGGLCLLVGIVLIGSHVGSYSLSDWISASNEIKASSIYTPSLILIFLGVFTKSAQFPFHFWLPWAMQAPTPVSAYLHSATMVKAGVFLLMRLNPVLGGTELWMGILPVVGSITMLVGAYMSITQTDIKAIFAYTTISSLGVLVFLMGIDTKVAVKAALVFLVVHAFYKAALFMLAGYIDKQCGTRDITRLGGLIKQLPLTFIVSALALFSMAGLPPMIGFIGKELIYEASVQATDLGFFILIMGVVANVFMVAVSIYFLHRVFIRKRAVELKVPLVNLYVFGPLVLSVLSLLLGVWPDALTIFLEPALEVVRAGEVAFKLQVWHGFNLVFVTSFFTVLGGAVLAWVLIISKTFMAEWRKFNRQFFTINLTDVFFTTFTQVISYAVTHTKRIQHGYNRYYIMSILLFTTLMIGIQLFLQTGWELPKQVSFQPFVLTGIIGVTAIATLVTSVSQTRINAIIAMGVLGYGISLIYLYYSAVDLAITQIIVETLTLIMFVIVLKKLPEFSSYSKKIPILRDVFIALCFGGVMTLLALKALDVELSHPISDYFIQNSYLKAYGKNVVNVILVDFRALDTMGEVIVLAVAAIGVYSLIRMKMKQS